MLKRMLAPAARSAPFCRCSSWASTWIPSTACSSGEVRGGLLWTLDGASAASLAALGCYAVVQTGRKAAVRCTSALAPTPAAPCLPAVCLPFTASLTPVHDTVLRSNHTGYPSWNGEVMSGEGLWRLVEGLEANGLVRHTHLLTGEAAAALQDH